MADDADESPAAVAEAPDAAQRPDDGWPAAVADALGPEPVLIAEGRSVAQVPAAGPVVIAASADRLLVVPGLRDQPPGEHAGTAVRFTDLIEPPDLRPPRWRRAPTLTLRTANVELRVAAPLAVLQAVVDRYAEATRPTVTLAELATPGDAPADVPPPPVATPTPERRVPAGYALRDGVLVPLPRAEPLQEMPDVDVP